MKQILKVIILAQIAVVYALAFCEIPCPQVGQMTEQSLESTTLKTPYKNVNDDLEDVKEAYEELLAELKTSNEKLDVAINLTKEKLLREKQILFALKQFNQLQGITNTIRAESLETKGK